MVRRTHSWTVFVLLASFLVYGLSPVRTAFDSRWSVHTAMSLVRGHLGGLEAYAPVLAANDDYAIDPDAKSPRTVYPIGVSLLATPAVLLVAAIDPGFEARLRTHVPDKFEHWFASLLGAIAAVLFFRLLMAEFVSLATALTGTLAFALGTTMWSDATRAMWQHAPLIIFLLIAMRLLQAAGARPDLAPPNLARYVGPALAAGYLMRPTAAIPIVVLSAYVLIYHRRQFIPYLLLAMAVGLPWLAFNWATLGQLLPAYYLVVHGATPTPPDFPFEGLLGLFLSPGRGLLVYSPFLLLAPWGFILSLRDPARRPLFIAYGLVLVASFTLEAQWANWWGGHSYGPRLLTDFLPFLCFFVAFVIDELRRPWRSSIRRPGRSSIAALVLLSIVMQAPGALTWRVWRWNVDPENVDMHPARLWDWRDPPFLRVFFGPS